MTERLTLPFIVLNAHDYYKCCEPVITCTDKQACSRLYRVAPKCPQCMTWAPSTGAGHCGQIEYLNLLAMVWKSAKNTGGQQESWWSARIHGRKGQGRVTRFGSQLSKTKAFGIEWISSYSSVVQGSRQNQLPKAIDQPGAPLSSTRNIKF